MILFALTSYVGAQTVSGYFTETTKPIEKQKNTIGGQTEYVYGVTATATGAEIQLKQSQANHLAQAQTA